MVEDLDAEVEVHEVEEVTPIRRRQNGKKAIEDYYFYVGSSKQVLDFETTYEFLLNHIEKTYTYGNDISEALRTLEDMSDLASKLQILKRHMNFY